MYGEKSLSEQSSASQTCTFFRRKFAYQFSLCCCVVLVLRVKAKYQKLATESLSIQANVFRFRHGYINASERDENANNIEGNRETTKLKIPSSTHITSAPVITPTTTSFSTSTSTPPVMEDSITATTSSSDELNQDQATTVARSRDGGGYDNSTLVGAIIGGIVAVVVLVCVSGMVVGYCCYKEHLKHKSRSEHIHSNEAVAISTEIEEGNSNFPPNPNLVTDASPVISDQDRKAVLAARSTARRPPRYSRGIALPLDGAITGRATTRNDFSIPKIDSTKQRKVQRSTNQQQRRKKSEVSGGKVEYESIPVAEAFAIADDDGEDDIQASGDDLEC